MKGPSSRPNARAVALSALLAGGDSAARLDQEIEKAALSAQDRGFATELAYGTLKMQRSLRWSLSRLVNRPFTALDRRLSWVLLLGAYQLLYLDRVPAHSAVDESVRLAAAGGHKGMAGLANAVLRRVAAERPMPPEPTATPDVCALADFASLPDWIARHLIERFGFSTAVAAARGMNAAPRRAIRLNEMPWVDHEGRPLQGVDESRYGIRECRVLGAAADMTQIRDLVRSGRASWQSEESQLAVHILDPKPGENVLDACCGRGVKTMMIANRLGGEGTVWAIDDDARKIAELERAAARSPHGIVRAVRADGRHPYPPPVPDAFDAALVDAPCSGLGIIGRKADARWRKREDDPARFAHVQRQVLERAAERVRAGGRLLYVTCSTHPAEDEAVVGDFLERHPQWSAAPAWQQSSEGMLELGPYRLTVPGIDGADGFFYALLLRGDSTASIRKRYER